jgi:hypothetical protein
MRIDTKRAECPPQPAVPKPATLNRHPAHPERPQPRRKPDNIQCGEKCGLSLRESLEIYSKNGKKVS